MKTEIKNRLVTILLAIAIIIATVSFSIGLPIYVRPFYYAHIDALDMPEDTGFTKEQIKEAYDEVLDYLTKPGREFGTGDLKFSEEGASHFADCKGLFILDTVAFFVSSAVLIVIMLLRRRGLVELTDGAGYGVTFWSGVSTLGIFALIAGVAAIDFDKAFEVFHTIFFPGKDNWLFNPRTDEIINVMPQEFFMNCAILIVSSIILICVALIVTGILTRRKKRA